VTLTPPEVAALLAEHGLAPSRALGQNFVIDPNTVRRIARLAGVGAGDHVVEIGAGLGSLTLALAETGATVTAVEVDRHLLPALRTVLAERFAFKAHIETRQQSIYELVRANPGGPLSSGLARVDIDCDALRELRGRGEKPALKPLPSGQFPCDMIVRGAAGTEIRSGGMKMADFGRSIQSGTGRIIVDKTGLEGFYAFTLRYTGTPSPDGAVPSLFAALQEQLGLRLQAATGRVRVLVIDNIQRPTEN